MGNLNYPKKECLCNNPICAKCLGGNCQDKSCPIHTKKGKIDYRKRWDRNHSKPCLFPPNY